MSKNYEIKTETVTRGNWLDASIYFFTWTAVDTSRKEEVTTVNDRDTGSTVTFNNKQDALDYVSKNSR